MPQKISTALALGWLGLALLAPLSTASCTPVECTKDSDCKGDRICEDDECVRPDDSSSTSTTGGGGVKPGDSCSEGGVCSSSTQLLYCESGSYVAYDCGEACSSMGFASDGCSGGQCQCGAPTDQHCLDGVSGFCSCLEDSGEPACTNEEMANAYGACHSNPSSSLGCLIDCMANAVSGNSVNCGAIISCNDQCGI